MMSTARMRAVSNAKVGWTPLLRALNAREFPLAEVLIRQGANVNARTFPGRRPPKSALQLAVQEDRPGLVELLVKHGADVQERLSAGRTLLSLAESAEVAELLLGAGIDIHERDEHGRSPLDHASSGPIRLVPTANSSIHNFWACGSSPGPK
jgi:ankyrin repeat protein